MGNRNWGEDVGVAKYQGLDRFQQNNPPAFSGGYNPDGAQHWLWEIEKIFQVVECMEEQKVAFGTYILVEKVKYWWDNTCQSLEAKGQSMTWETFKRVFL